MSRLVGPGLLLLDASTTIASFMNSPFTLAMLTVSLLLSIAVASMSAMVRSVFFPTYFWG